MLGFLRCVFLRVFLQFCLSEFLTHSLTFVPWCCVCKEASRKAQALGRSYVDRHGKKRVTGLKKELKQSQWGSEFKCGRQCDTDDMWWTEEKSYAVEMLRVYTCAYGYKLNSLLPRMHECIKGFRSWKEPIVGLILLVAFVDMSMSCFGQQRMLPGLWRWRCSWAAGSNEVGSRHVVWCWHAVGLEIPQRCRSTQCSSRASWVFRHEQLRCVHHKP